MQDNTQVASYVLEHALISTPHIEDVGYLRWEKINSYGGYCLVHSWLDDMEANEARDMSGADTPLPGCSPECGMSGLISVCFNIYTKQFTLLHHPIVKNTPSTHHLWNGQVITNNSNEDSQSPTYRLIRSVNCCSDQRDIEGDGQLTPVHIYTSASENGNGGFLQRRRKVNLEMLPEHGNVSFALNTNQRMGSRRNQAPRQLGMKRLVGDDSFLLFVDGGGYSAWSFGDEIPGQLADDRKTRWWRKFQRD